MSILLLATLVAIEIKLRIRNLGEPDGTSGIIMITKNGIPVANSSLGERVPLNLYYSYGLRNSFGIDFDPLTGKLWDTENGDDLVMKLILLNQALIAYGVRCKVHRH